MKSMKAAAGSVLTAGSVLIAGTVTIGPACPAWNGSADGNVDVGADASIVQESKASLRAVTLREKDN